MKQIVSLILEKGGKFLLEKRKSDNHRDPNSYVFPGGHVEEGETLEDALVRESKEELSITPIDPLLVYTVKYDNERSDESQELFWFLCTDFEGDITNNEADELIWITFDEIDILTYDVGKEALRTLKKAI